MRIALESGLPIVISDSAQAQPAFSHEVTDEVSEARESHAVRLMMKRLKWWPSWSEPRLVLTMESLTDWYYTNAVLAQRVELRAWEPAAEGWEPAAEGWPDGWTYRAIGNAVIRNAGESDG